MSVAKDEAPTAALSRRDFVGAVAALGFGASALPSTLWAETEQATAIDKDAIAAAERLAGIELSEDERALMLKGLRELPDSYRAIRKLAIANQVAPAFRFDPEPPGFVPPPQHRGATLAEPGEPPVRPDDPDELAFLPVTALAHLIRTRAVRPQELVELYLDRLRRLDPKLRCVITLTEERARRQAEIADREIVVGRYRGPLHGIPWGAKDLLAVRGYKTTWGAQPYEDQVIDEDATVVRKLDEAGAVLVAKLTLGALAWGDVWFGGMTRNPWNPEQGSSGSSAGSASATAAGLVGFAIGSETWGSIVSPSTRCGTTGLRPTFGRVSRHGAMALSWTMDKLGPLCRSVEDCALVLHAIHGRDAADASAVDLPFGWNGALDLGKLRVGYTKSLFEEKPREGREESHAHDLRTLEVLRQLGVELIPVALPDLPTRQLSFILSAEAAAAFDQLTLSGRDDELVRQIEMAWPNVFRQARMIPAVEYIQANRARTLLIRAMAEVMRDIDLFVAPSFGGTSLLLTNLTGHPAVVLPNGFKQDGTPTSITFTGRLYGETELLAVAKAYQDATGFQLRHPSL